MILLFFSKKKNQSSKDMKISSLAVKAPFFFPRLSSDYQYQRPNV